MRAPLYVQTITTEASIVAMHSLCMLEHQATGCCASVTRACLFLFALEQVINHPYALCADPLTPRELAMQCGLVFQFPERYFLSGTLQEVSNPIDCNVTALHACCIALQTTLSQLNGASSCASMYMTWHTCVSSANIQSHVHVKPQHTNCYHNHFDKSGPMCHTCDSSAPKAMCMCLCSPVAVNPAGIDIWLASE